MKKRVNRKKTGNKVFNAFSNEQLERDRQLINREHRLQCLNLATAINNKGEMTADNVVETANKFYQFIRKSEENDKMKGTDNATS